MLDLKRLDVATRQSPIPKDQQESLLPITRRTQHVPYRRRSVHYGDGHLGCGCQYQAFVRDRGDQQSLFLRGQLWFGLESAV